MTEKSILVIDTDAETSRNIKTILESEGYAVYNSSGRSESISTALKIKPSLVFINIAMRDTSGLEIAKGIHESDPLKDVPIIIITPHGGSVEPRYTVMYGIVDFIKKSFTAEELISKTIDVTEMNSSGRVQTEEQSVQPDEQDAPRGASDETPVAKELGEDELHFTESNTPPPEAKEPFQGVSAGISTDIAPKSGRTDDYEAPEYGDRLEEAEGPEPVAEKDSQEDGHSGPAPEESDGASAEDDVPQGRAPRRPRLATFIVISVFVLIAAGVGVYLYTGLSDKPEVAPPVALSPSPVPQQDVQKPGQSPNPTPEPSPEMKRAEQGAKTSGKNLPAQASKSRVQELEKRKPETAKPAPAKESGLFYSVQVGVFKNKANAAALVRHFSGLNYRSFSYETQGKNRERLYRVLIGRFQKRAEAETMAKEIRSKENTGALVFAAPGRKK